MVQSVPLKVSSTLILRPTTVADLAFVLTAEQHADNSPYVGQWTQARHEAAISSENEAHFVAVATIDNQSVGYVILTEVSSPHRTVALRRIVVTRKQQGYGRELLQWIKAYVFETLGYHRLWFDVLLSNQRAQALYRSEGFVVEGRLRDSWKTASGYEDMLLMSMLAHEYQTLKNE